MKSCLFPVLMAVCTVALADVPSLINYQGRLTDSNGDPVTGTKNFSLTIYDAETGGNPLYSENVGSVTLDANGIYSFQFGSAGTSVVSTTESVATTDGTLTVFTKVLSNTAINGSVSITDGTYSWSQTSGSSAPASFLGSFDSGSGTVSAIYLGGVPAAGVNILATYRHEASGVIHALALNGEHWMSLAVDGMDQGSRCRVLTVPFASMASKATKADAISGSTNFEWMPEVWATQGQFTGTYPLQPLMVNASGSAACILPNHFKRLEKIKGSYAARIGGSNATLTAGASVTVSVIEITKNPHAESVVFQENITPGSGFGGTTNYGDFALTASLNINPAKLYRIEVASSSNGSTTRISYFSIVGPTTERK